MAVVAVDLSSLSAAAQLSPVAADARVVRPFLWCGGADGGNGLTGKSAWAADLCGGAGDWVGFYWAVVGSPLYSLSPAKIGPRKKNTI